MELQWRQVHPQNWDGTVVSQAAFAGAGSGDESRQISTSRESVVTAEEAFTYHTSTMSLQSAGTWAASVAEVTAVGARVIDDATCADVETPGHSYIDMRDLEKLERKVARAQLATDATARGRLHP